jgi:hypothetical protein
MMGVGIASTLEKELPEPSEQPSFRRFGGWLLFC